MEKRPNEKKKKMAAPIVIAILFLVYMAFYVAALVTAAAWTPVFVLFAIPAVGLGIGMVYTLRERIKEIRSGEEDDLDNY